LLIAASRHGAAQAEAVAFPLGAIVPHITCLADSKQSYALYLPSTFSATRKWPIIYVFDPFAHGPVATEIGSGRSREIWIHRRRLQQF
jgi:hypothetical protein